MRHLALILMSVVFCLTTSQAETLGEALQRVESQTEAILARHPSPETWGESQAVDDLNRFLLQAKRLSAGLSGQDAHSVESLQKGLRSTAGRVKTSRVLLSDSESKDIDAILELAGQVSERLSDMRLRFGGLASSVDSNLASLPLDDAGLSTSYTNLNELLVDVRWARQLSLSLQPATFPQQGFNFGYPNNLDPLQVRRVQRAAWALERALSGRVDDVSQSKSVFERFRREFDRLGYAGTGTSYRQLTRIVARLDQFYYQGDLGR